jgi:hypothetical protein
VHSILRISEGSELLVIMGCPESLDIVAFWKVYRDIGLTNYEITSSCCAEGSPELIMLAKDVDSMIDHIVIAMRRG